MRTRAALVVALAGALGLATACEHAPAAVAPPAPAVPLAGPPLTRPGSVYRAAYALPGSEWGWAHLVGSYYVLYEDGTLTFLFGSLAVPGRYARAPRPSDTRLTFEYEGAGVRRWGATATLRGDSLRVEYNDVMLWSDFPEGMYVRVP